MAKNVVGLFENVRDAQSAIRDIESGGFGRGDVSLVQNASGQLSGIFGQLGIPQDDASIYTQAIQSGGAMVIAQQLADADADQVADIMDRNNIVDIDNWRQRFQQGAGATTSTSFAQTAATTSGFAQTGASTGSMSSGSRRSSSYQGGETVIPIVEEELQIGKREVESGGVRVNVEVEERPVNEQVTLRDEQVHVERRRIDQPLDAATAATAFQEGTFEVHERDEQAVVQKQARVVEEVVVNKEVQQRTETVQDTVRRTDVDVQELGGVQQASGYQTTGSVGGTQDEGMIERGLSQAGNALERGTGLDIDRDSDVGQRDPRNNI